MLEKRKTERLPIETKLTVTNLYKENTNTLMDLNLNVDIIDISSKGIGFVSQCIFPVGYFFIANIELASDLPQIITDVRVVRSNPIDKEHYHYGAEFIEASPSVKKMLEKFDNEIRPLEG